jgi:AraC-like DNA-binding protein
LINKTDDSLKINFNQTLREKFDLDYDCLSELFYDAQGIKIEQFILLYKIERIKEMIIYDELSMNEIAQKLNYINVALLYLQFKKSTGLSPYHFRQMKINRSFMIKSVRDI